MAEFERNLIRERTQVGLSAARGRKGGRPRERLRRVETLFSELAGEPAVRRLREEV